MAYCQANNAKKRFASQDGDHITFINVLRIYSLEVEEGQRGGDVDSSTLDRRASKKTEKVVRNWCTANYINGRSLRRAIDIRKQIQGHMESMGLPITSCGEDMLVFRRCLAASFFLNAARRQLDGTYRSDHKSTEQKLSSPVLDRNCVYSNVLLYLTWMQMCPLYHATSRNVLQDFS
jgi:ATP-dependent RNA helicase DHX8/PRP22